jgi:hypothetical protein
VAYFAICGQAPDEAAARLAGKQMVPASERGKGRFSQEFLAVIDQGLNLLPWDRFLDVPAMRTALRALPHFEDVAQITAAATAPLLDDNAWQPTVMQPSGHRPESVMPTVQVFEHDIPTVQQPLPTFNPTLTPTLDRPAASPRSAVWVSPRIPDTVTPASTSARRHWPAWSLAAVTAVVLLTIAGLWAWRQQQPMAQPTPLTTAPTSIPAPPTPTAAGPLPAAPVAATVATPAPATVTGLDCAESNASWGCVVGGLARVSPAVGQLDFSISPSVARAGESLQVMASSATGGYLYLYSIDDHSGARAELLFPNTRDRNNQMLPGLGVQLPRANWQLELQPPVGRVWIVAVVTREPLNPATSTGERPLLPAAVQAFAQRTPMRTLGWPACAVGSLGCPEALAVSTTEMTIR